MRLVLGSIILEYYKREKVHSCEDLKIAFCEYEKRSNYRRLFARLSAVINGKSLKGKLHESEDDLY